MIEIATLKNVKPNQVIWRIDKNTKEVSITPHKTIILNKVTTKDYVFEDGFLYTLAVTRKQAIKNFNRKKIINSSFLKSYGTNRINSGQLNPQ